MTFLQTSAPRKSLITAYLQPGNGGYPLSIDEVAKGRSGCWGGGAETGGEERNGAPGAIRTPDLLVRSQLLYPAELRAHIALDATL
jgi:hypothetical protein